MPKVPDLGLTNQPLRVIPTQEEVESEPYVDNLAERASTESRLQAIQNIARKNRSEAPLSKTIICQRGPKA